MLSTRRALVGGGLMLTALLVGMAGLVAVNGMARQTVREEHNYAFIGKALSINAASGSARRVRARSWATTSGSSAVPPLATRSTASTNSPTSATRSFNR